MSNCPCAFFPQAEEDEKRWQEERSDLLRDQAGLQKLHDNLQQDYDSLLKDKDSQKEVERQLRADLRKMEVRTTNWFLLRPPPPSSTES